MNPNVSASTTVTQDAIQQLQLDNGLQLVWQEDHRQPLVAIEARIKGGLRGEGALVGTGITHFIEHMLFKGTPTRPAGTIEQEVRRYGGTINAFTSFDTTGVSLFVESRYLREALGMLADILQHAVFEEKEFEKERAVVISEIQMNLDDPDRRISQLLWSRHFLEHPYRHPILGYQTLLEKLAVKDMATFYAMEYQPQNVTVACVGDIDGLTFPELVKSAFGSWARGTGDPLQQMVPLEPSTVSAKITSAELPVNTAYVLLGFSSVRLSDPDVYPLDVLAGTVGRGRSARLYETVVRKQQLAHTVTAWNYTPYDPGIFGIQLATDAEKVDAAVHSVVAVLDEIKQKGITDGELQKAKRQVAADYLFGLQTVEAKAADLANSLSATGDPLYSRRYVEGIDRVTAQQVQAAAQRYLDANKMTTAIIRPSTAVAKKSAPSTTPQGIQLKKTALSNGATVLVGRDASLPIAAIIVAFHGGVRVETEDTQGLSNLVAQMLTKGTKHKTASQVAQQVESLGGTLEPFSGRDGFGVVLQLLAEDLPEGLRLMHELVTESIFDDKELEIQRQLIAKELRAQDDEIFQVGGRALRRSLFSQHPYRFNPLGDQATIGKLTREQCLTFVKRWLAPSNMIVGAFGALDVTSVTQQIQRSFGAIPSSPSLWPAQLPEDPLKTLREVTQIMEREQALIMLGFRGTTATSADRYAVDVMTAILSGMAGRLFQAVRERYGLSYTLGAVHMPGWDPGYLLIYAATKPQEQAKVTQVLDEQLQLTLTQGFTNEEVEQAKRYLIGENRMNLQHLVELAKRSALDELSGLGYDAWKGYEAKINAVTVPLVNEVAKRYLTMEQRARIVISPNGHRNPLRN